MRRTSQQHSTLRGRNCTVIALLGPMQFEKAPRRHRVVKLVGKPYVAVASNRRTAAANSLINCGHSSPPFVALCCTSLVARPPHSISRARRSFDSHRTTGVQIFGVTVLRKDCKGKCRRLPLPHDVRAADALACHATRCHLALLAPASHLCRCSGPLCPALPA